MPDAKPRYPECDRMVAAAEVSHRIGEFLDWLNDQGIRLAEYQTKVDCEATAWETIGGMPRWRCVDGTVTYLPSLGIDPEPHAACDGTGFVTPEDPPLVTHVEPYEQLLARFFDIDLNRVEAERRQMLDELRKAAK